MYDHTKSLANDEYSVAMVEKNIWNVYQGDGYYAKHVWTAFTKEQAIEWAEAAGLKPRGRRA